MAKKQHKKRRKNRGKQKEQLPMLFSKQNYILMLIGIASVIIGYTGMYFERSVDGFFSLYITPLMVIGGFIVVAIAILKTDKKVVPEPETDPIQE